jgi:hypothetical protein
MTYSPMARLLQNLLALGSIGCCVAMAMPQVHLVSMCVDAGFGNVAGSRMLSTLLVGGCISRIGSGFLADKIGGSHRW